MERNIRSKKAMDNDSCKIGMGAELSEADMKKAVCVAKATLTAKNQEETVPRSQAATFRLRPRGCGRVSSLR